MCKTYDLLPSSLCISNISLISVNPTGLGGFSDIFHALHGAQPVALKRIRISLEGKDQKELRRMFRQEALVWKNLTHSYVLPFLGIANDVFHPHWCMVLPWMDHGSIVDCIHRGVLQRINIQQFLYEVAQGLEYLHSQRIVHGDLRGANILVDDNWHPQLADFGLASLAEPITSHTTSGRGCPRWMAPELQYPENFSMKFQRTPATDVYAFGCTCLELYTAQIPFCELSNNTTVIFKVLDGERPSRPRLNLVAELTDKMWSLIEACWKQSHSERPSAQEAVRLMWEEINNLTLTLSN
ncbi:kinase-like domain-containing protein [Hygrophoropsis aurantiaca]|uniref:Kinase-like domain-containing protein n=1 Tax=Hygrophoropsis aurantiaca TaxID=72124 RepID=A0ACB8AGK9_9AGAM|nr:kinase-like domain-containing protein [Hygrophoropsis aurantiaca]